MKSLRSTVDRLDTLDALPQTSCTRARMGALKNPVQRVQPVHLHRGTDTDCGSFPSNTPRVTAERRLRADEAPEVGLPFLGGTH